MKLPTHICQLAIDPRDPSAIIQAQADRIADLEDAIRGVVLCTKEPGGACVCIQYAETILNKK